MEWFSVLLGFSILGALGLWCWWHDKPEVVRVKNPDYDPNG